MEKPCLETELTNGTLTLRRPMKGDREMLVAGRDAEFHRFMGDGDADPDPFAIALNSEGEIVGWIDYDGGRDWLTEDEVNIGYNIFPEHRGQGFARGTLLILLSFLADNSDLTTATLLVDPANSPSLAVAERTGFGFERVVDGQLLFKLQLGH